MKIRHAHSDVLSDIEIHLNSAKDSFLIIGALFWPCTFVCDSVSTYKSLNSNIVMKEKPKIFKILKQ